MKGFLILCLVIAAFLLLCALVGCDVGDAIGSKLVDCANAVEAAGYADHAYRLNALGRCEVMAGTVGDGEEVWLPMEVLP